MKDFGLSLIHLNVEKIIIKLKLLKVLNEIFE